MEKRKILLHTCCAPCIGYVYQLLDNEYSVVSYFYNPNITPVSEYKKRLLELQRFASTKGFPVIEGPGDTKNWTQQVKKFRFEGEKSVRCRECFRIRLEETFREAQRQHIGVVATVLSISPHKDSSMINEIGNDLSERYGIMFLEADFKKKDGFKKSLEISREYGFYRQSYCGCVYSRHEMYRSRQKR